MDRRDGIRLIILLSIYIICIFSQHTYAKNKMLTALVVDDNTLDAKRVGICLKRAGFKVKRVYKRSEVSVKEYDAIVIPGGHNITPSIYGAKRSHYTYGTDSAKDKLQIYAVKMFKKAKKPILGICRGEQLVNVALGGTINQHIGTRKGNKSGSKKGWHTGYRKITIRKDSWLYPIYGKTQSVVHSHHQCVKKLGKGLRVTQWDSQSGIIEGYEHKSLPVYGVQWHPDHWKPNDGDKLFEEFYRICLREKD